MNIDQFDALTATRRETAEGVVFDLCYCRAAAALWPSEHRSHHVGVGISGLSRLSAKQPLQEIQNHSKLRPSLPSILHEPPLFKQRVYEFFRVKGQKIAGFFTNADVSNWQAQFSADRDDYSTFGGAVELG
jgi:hypothetical protein